MSLEEFKVYVTNSGVVFESLTNEEKRGWRETFDKGRAQPQGRSFSNSFRLAS
jgi:hypothetical protein